MGYWDSYERAYAAQQRQGQNVLNAVMQQQDRKVASALNAKDYDAAGNLLAQQGRTDDVLKLQEMQTERQNTDRTQARGYMANAAGALLQVPADQRKAQYAQTIAPTLKQLGMPDDLIAQIGGADMSDQALQSFAAALGVGGQREKLEFRQAGQDVFALDPYTGQKVAQYTGTVDPRDARYRDAQIAALEGKGAAADAKAAEKAEKSQRALDEQQYKAEALIGAVDEVLGKIGMGEAGLIGAQMSQVPGTKAYDVRENLETIKANLGFQELAAMRAASPTGGALGAIAVQELKALQATVGNLDIGQSEAQLKRELEKIKTHYSRWLDTVRKAAAEQQQPQAAYSQDDLIAEARRRGLIR